MEHEDDRTSAERITHRWAWGGTDSFLSGWGKAQGGSSFAFWAVTPDTENECRKWVESRGDIKRVRFVNLDDYRPRGRGHCHVYVYTPK